MEYLYKPSGEVVVVEEIEMRAHILKAMQEHGAMTYYWYFEGSSSMARRWHCIHFTDPDNTHVPALEDIPEQVLMTHLLVG